MSPKEGTILKGKGSSSNHHFSGAILVVSGEQQTTMLT